MKIGNELKKLRLELGLSQTEMAGDILTKSYYSKIERGLHEINAQDLVDILALHGIEVSDFFIRMEKLNKKEKILERLRTAYYRQDIDEIKRIERISAQDNRYQEVHTIADIFLHFFNHLPLTQDEKTKIKRLILHRDSWNIESLRLFAMAFYVFNDSELDTILNIILKRYKDIKKIDRETQGIIGGIVVNYLNTMYIKENHNITKVETLRNFLDELPIEPRNMYFRIMSDYYEALFWGDKKETRGIIDFFNSHGMQQITTYFAH